MSKFLQYIIKAGQAELDAVEDKISDLREQLQFAESIRDILHAKVMNGSDRVPKSNSSKSENRVESSRENYRRKIVLYLKANGMKTKEDIVKHFKLASNGWACATSLLNCGYFHVNPDGVVTLTEKGERTFLV